MSLENPTQKQQEKTPLTPEMIKALEGGYELGVEHLREKNIANLEKARLISSPEDKKKIIMRLGWISIKAAKANEELRRSLN